MTNFNDKKEIGISIVRSAFSAVPFVGQLLNEIAFEFRGRIKQERLNKFTELLSEFFGSANDFEIENLKTEDFSDLLESVLKRVVLTRSEQKHKRFRDILINKIKNPSADIDNSEIYLDLITSLNEEEITILFYHQSLDQNFENDRNAIRESERNLVSKNEALTKEKELKEKGFANNFDTIQSEIYEFETTLNVAKQKMDTLQQYRKHSFYELTADRFLYYKQSLFSKALIIDSGVGAIGVRPFQSMSITEFGKDFMKFIMQT